MLNQRTVLAMLKAAAEPTRLRVLALLSHGELSVKDLARILGQSQPRISRHLKLLTEAGLVERLRDGSWAYFQLVDNGPRGGLLTALLDNLDRTDATLARDHSRAETVKREREAAAQEYFRENAAEWDRIRALHIPEREVEAAVKAALGSGGFKLLIDLGTGTGRMLELAAGRFERAVGFDMNHTMLAYARGKLDAAGIKGASVRHGDIYDLALPNEAADAIIMHQVLHFLTEPAHALHEAARILMPGGRLVIVDFAPHNMEFLRDGFAHERMGFADAQIRQWLRDANLEVEKCEQLVRAEGAGGKLTVMVWAARRPGSSAPAGSVEAGNTVEARAR